MNKRRTRQCFPMVTASMLTIMLTILTILFMTVATAAAAPPARCPQRPANLAQAKAHARAWYFYGHKLFKGKYFTHAVAAFLCANTLRPARLAIYWAGRSAEAAGRNAQAVQLYRQLLANPPASIPKTQLVGRIARLQPAAPAPGARPGTTPTPRPATPPGARPTGAPPPPPTLTFKPATRPSGARPGTPVTTGTLPPSTAGAVAPVAPGRHHRPMTPVARSSKATLRSQMGDAGLTMSVLSGVSIVAAVILGAVVDHNKKKIEDAEPGTFWDPDLKERQDRIKRMQTGMWICLGVGIATGLTAGILYLARPKKEATARGTSLMIAPTRKGATAGVNGRF